MPKYRELESIVQKLEKVADRLDDVYVEVGCLTPNAQHELSLARDAVRASIERVKDLGE